MTEFTGLDVAAVEQLFPLHFVFDADLRVVRASPRLVALVGGLSPGTPFTDDFELERPRVPVRFAELTRLGQVSVVFRSTARGVQLRGQLVAVGATNHWMFAGSPVVSDIGELAPLGLKLTDFPPHDARLDLLVMVAAKNAALTDATQLAARLRELHDREASRARALAGEVVHQERVASLGRVVSSVVQEVSSPLGVAYTAGSLAVEATDDLARALAAAGVPDAALRLLAEAREALGTQQVNLRRATDLLREFKDLAVDQAGSGVRDLDLGPFAEDVLHRLRPVFLGTRIHARVACPAPVALRTRPAVLAQVLTHLVTNAVLHAFEFSKAGTITVHIESEGSGATLEVQDDGVGMLPEVAARVFDPFFTTRRSAEGSGLGLFIVHHAVVEILGGTIALDTAPGTGTRFRVHIPSDVGT